MATLHLIQSSPYQTTALSRCLEQLHEKDAILLLENGVYATSISYQLTKKASTPCFALEADLKARGIDQLDSSITVIDYKKFVELIAQFDNSLTWN
ncbi:sulfurtransferase complex subunit TusB [Piscirickettsia litoralis]|uniref:Sulfur relay protein DsrH n=1 Tax=Piscirickettsia litoralis TaxID=1891921 RepID=A0ABX3A407_9GAMM|nr:sulfurtransferase complex subunit TusB [Piscirickettsia litoralis]ODN43601.1 sulfur relay protein DsrH [Piscirickettsia litoralis]